MIRPFVKNKIDTLYVEMLTPKPKPKLGPKKRKPDLPVKKPKRVPLLLISF